MFGYQEALILDEVSIMNSQEWINHRGPIVDKKAEVVFSASRDQLYITDLKHAFKRGKDCVKYHINIKNTREANPKDLIQHAGTLKDLLMKFHCSLDWSDTRSHELTYECYNEQFVEFEIWKNEQKGVRTYSPLDKHQIRVKPLTDEPKKWTTTMAIRALLNGQFDHFKSNFTYTDDYRRDSANNYSKGEIKAVKNFVAKMVQNGDYSVWDNDEGIINVNPHANDSNEFKFNAQRRQFAQSESETAEA